MTPKMEFLARKHHAGKFRRDGITPAINHIADVAYRLRSADDIVTATAWGHDLIEDGLATAGQLKRMGVADVVVYCIEQLTFPKDISVDEYLQHITEIAQNAVLRRVKIADNLSNLSDSPTESQIKKYSVSLDILLSYELPQYTYTGSSELCNPFNIQ